MKAILLISFLSLISCNQQDKIDSTEAEIWRAEALKEEQSQKYGEPNKTIIKQPDNLSKKLNNNSNNPQGFLVSNSDDDCKRYIRDLESYNDCIDICELGRFDDSPCGGFLGWCGIRPTRPFGCSVF